jgi:biotin carboxyl carrier protein
MRTYATVPSHPEPVPVDVEETSPGRYVVRFHDRTLTVDALSFADGALSLLIGNESYGVDVEALKDSVAVTVRGQTVKLGLADERALRLRSAGNGNAATGKQVITAPMPGKVVKVLVALGDQVEAGQGLVVVEAMKMENELKSPKAGKVTELPAKEGTTVENNAKLVVVE